MEVRKLNEQEIHKVQEFVPIEWNLNLIDLVKKYYTKSYFYPMTAAEGSELLAVGNLFIFGNSAWIGHVLVKGDLKRKGIGTILMKALIEYAKDKGIQSINLAATKQGEFLYTKLGFKEDGEYYLYKGIYQGEISSHIKPINKDDGCSIIEIDHKITAEMRADMFDEKILNGYKYIDAQGKATGFFLPNFGQGLVLAEDDQAGIELMKVKHFEKEALTAIPDTNKAGITFLEKQNFQLTDKAKRMYLGKYTSWMPKQVFGRGNAYSG